MPRGLNGAILGNTLSGVARLIGKSRAAAPLEWVGPKFLINRSLMP
jgi:hypothetical protein